MIANTPNPTYIATVFTSIRTDVEEGYDEMNELTFKELEIIEGYFGYEAFRNKNSFGVNVSYLKDMEALKNWRDNTLHQKAQELVKEKWYTNYKLRICNLVRDYEFEL